MTGNKNFVQRKQEEGYLDQIFFPNDDFVDASGISARITHRLPVKGIRVNPYASLHAFDEICSFDYLCTEKSGNPSWREKFLDFPSSLFAAAFFSSRFSVMSNGIYFFFSFLSLP